MSYVIGQIYKHVDKIENHVPIYKYLTITQMYFDKIILSDGSTIYFIPVNFSEMKYKQ